MGLKIVTAVPQQETRSKGMLIGAVGRDEEYDPPHCRVVGQTSTKLRPDPHGLGIIASRYEQAGRVTSATGFHDRTRA